MSQKNSDRSRQMVIAIALLLLLLLGIGGWGTSQLMQPSIDDDRLACATPYPPIWTGRGLPEIPEGQIVCQQPGPAGASHFEVVTTLDPAEVGEFLECELSGPQWECEEEQGFMCPDYENEFFNNNTEILISASPDPLTPDSTRVDIVIRHYQPAPSRPTGFTSSSHGVYSY